MNTEQQIQAILESHLSTSKTDILLLGVVVSTLPESLQPSYKIEYTKESISIEIEHSKIEKIECKAGNLHIHEIQQNEKNKITFPIIISLTDPYWQLHLSRYLD